jgi:hypothetical protein
MGRRIRSLKPELIEDEKVGPLSDTAFRLFTSMITLADDHGNVRADVRWLQAQIWWAHPSPPNVLLALIELCRGHLIEVYGVRGGTYAHLKGWGKHQRIDNAGKGSVPPLNDADAHGISLSETEGSPMDDSVPPRLAEIRRELPRLAAGSGEVGNRKGEGEDIGLRAEPRAKAKRATRLAADWSPRDEERISAEGSGLTCDREVDAFRDHHSAKGSTMADWDAAFRTWLRNAVKFGRGAQQSIKTGRIEPKTAEAYADGEVAL